MLEAVSRISQRFCLDLILIPMVPSRRGLAIGDGHARSLPTLLGRVLGQR
jgi:hypothetical protein